MHLFLLIFVGELLQGLPRCHTALLSTSDISSLMGSDGTYVTKGIVTCTICWNCCRDLFCSGSTATGNLPSYPVNGLRQHSRVVCILQNSKRLTKVCAAFLVVGVARCNSLLPRGYAGISQTTESENTLLALQTSESLKELFPTLWCAFCLAKAHRVLQLFDPQFQLFYYQIQWSSEKSPDDWGTLELCCARDRESYRSSGKAVMYSAIIHHDPYDFFKGQISELNGDMMESCLCILYIFEGDTNLSH